jgi:cytochrome P450
VRDMSDASDGADRRGIPDHVPLELVHEFDINFRGPLEDLFPRFDALRDEGRVVWITDSFGAGAFSGGLRGAWLLTHAEDIREALQHPDLFSSDFGAAGGIPALIPSFMDPPDHTRYRKILQPLFAPAVVAEMAASVQDRMVAIVDDLEGRGACDFVADVAVQFPTRVFTSWMGLPEEDTGRFVALVSALIHGEDEVRRIGAVADAFGVLNDLIEARMADPQDDLMSRIAAQEIDGRPLDHGELMSIAFLLFLAGLDTVVAALSFSFAHLAQSPEARAAMASGAVATDEVVEEMLRRHSFVNLPRRVARDGEFAGVALKTGDPVVVPLALAGRDPDEHEHATEVDLDRESTRHFAFGVGAHRCLGSHLARMEMAIAFDEWHARIPDYRVDGDVGAYAGTVMGVTTLPLRWS